MKQETNLTRAARSLMPRAALGLLLTAALTAGLASCTNDTITEPDARPDAPLTLTIRGTVGNENNPKSNADTRASVAPGNDDATKGEAFRWNEGDDFDAYLMKTNDDGNGTGWVTSDASKFWPAVSTRFNIDSNYSDDKPGASADFTGTFAAAGTYQMLALYPGTLKADGTTPAFTTSTAYPNRFSFSMPATGQTQTGTATTHLRDNMLMWAKTTDAVTVGSGIAPAPALRFHHLTAMMRFTVKNKSAAARRVTAIGIKASSTVFATGGYLGQGPGTWANTPDVDCSSDKLVNTITLATRDDVDDSKGIALAAASKQDGTDGGTLDAYLLTLPGYNLTSQTLTFTVTMTDDDGTHPRTYESRALSGNDILAKNPGADAFEPGKRYWFDLDLDSHAGALNVASFSVADWALGTDIPATDPAATDIRKIDAADPNAAPTYEIRTAAGLKAFADIINGTDDGAPRTFCGINIPGTPAKDARKSNARLMADIDLGTLCGASIEGKSKSWTPIGKNDDYPYTGTFDGAGHTVRGLYIDDERKEINTADRIAGSIHRGLFGYINGATVQHLAVEGNINLRLTATQGIVGLQIYAGGIAGYATGTTTLTGCHSAVSISATGEHTVAGVASAVCAGGIVGSVYRATGSRLADCSSTGAVSATSKAVTADYEAATAGGICGYSVGGTLTGCSHTTGAVSATTEKGNTCAGGVVGYASVYSTPVQLLGCTNTAAVSGASKAATGTGSLYIGGVAGQSQAAIVACSNSGAITYTSGRYLSAGGVVGENYNTVAASLSTGTLGGTAPSEAGTQSYIGGIIGFNGASASTCFYSGTTDLGTNGIGNNRNSNTNCGRVDTAAGLNGKVGDMNAAIEKYNDGTLNGGTAPANPCPYRWIKANGKPQVRKK